MLTKRMAVKLLILVALTLGVFTTTRREASAQMGDSCASGCVTFDDGAPGCASYDQKTNGTCGMVYSGGRNYCVQWECAPMITE
ncbi:MAG TPA: hypothetical protein VM934_02395 [Pyrinomonadaceae bacterium]|jgi:hypothetical protein|nr:hypothetical protein [Pyrinomonadaceae bacterium]